jgi:hypothetical protein
VNDPILSRQAIAADADAAAARFVEYGVEQPNRFDQHMEPEAHAIWAAAYRRYVLARSAPEAEGGA